MCLYSPGPKPNTSSLSSSRSKGQTAAQSASCQIYNTGEALRHILTFSQRGTWRSTASPGRCNLDHPRRPWGRSSLHRVNLSSGKNYVDLKLCAAHSTAVTFNCQANLHCSTFKSASLSCALWRWTLTSFDRSSQRFFAVWCQLSEGSRFKVPLGSLEKFCWVTNKTYSLTAHTIQSDTEQSFRLADFYLRNITMVTWFLSLLSPSWFGLQVFN